MGFKGGEELGESGSVVNSESPVECEGALKGHMKGIGSVLETPFAPGGNESIEAGGLRRPGDAAKETEVVRELEDVSCRDDAFCKSWRGLILNRQEKKFSTLDRIPTSDESHQTHFAPNPEVKGTRPIRSVSTGSPLLQHLDECPVLCAGDTENGVLGTRVNTERHGGHGVVNMEKKGFGGKDAPNEERVVVA